MDTRVLCVYNHERGALLSSKVTPADGVNEPLKILKELVSGLGLGSASGLWISPISTIPSVPRLFPFDLIYLDRDQRVVTAAEVVPGSELPPYQKEVVSALVLANRTSESTKTTRGDRLIICVESELKREIAAADASVEEPIAAGTRSGGKAVGRVERNGKDHPLVGKGVEGEPFSSVVARLAKGAISGTEQAGKGAIAKETAAGESTNGRAKEDKPSEKVVGRGRVADKPAVPAEAARQEEEKSTAAVPGAKGASSPATETESRAAVHKDLLERPGNETQTVVTGQHGGVEDLFSNWVDAPSSSAWIPRNPRPGPAPASQATPKEDLPEAVGEEKRREALGSKQAEEPKKAESKQADEPMKVETKKAESEKAETEKAVAAPKPVSIPLRAAEKAQPPERNTVATGSVVRGLAPATTFTVSNLGMWRVTLPTAAGSLSSAPSSSPKEEAPAVTEKQTSKSSVEPEKAPPVQRAKDFVAGDSAAADGKQMRELPKETMRSQSTGKLEVAAPAASKPAGEQAVSLESAGKEKSGAEKADLQDASADSEATRLAKVAPKVSAAVTAEKPAVESRGQVPVETVAEAQAPSRDAVQKVTAKAAEALKAVVPAEPAVEPEQTKVPPKAAAPARTAAPAKSAAAPKVQPKPATERPGVNGKSKTAPASLGERFKRWLAPVTPAPSDRRRAHRRYVPGMVAHYYTGGSPKPHQVADISMSGFYLLTEDRWMPDTMIQMTLQKPCAKGERKQTIVVLSRIVRRGSDGVGAEFVMPEGLNPMSHDIQPSQATDRFSLARFL